MPHSNPMFSVIIPHYEHSVPNKYLLRALDSLEAQTYTNFEILLYHDGPKKKPFSEDIDLAKYTKISHIDITKKRAGDWGHSLRDLGIRKAKGDYIVHLNADNILYPFAFERMIEELGKERGKPFKQTDGINVERFNSTKIIIFPILMIGFQTDGLNVWYENRNNPEHAMILTGYPAFPGFIDCMQLVMRRELWLSYGGWYDKSEASDGEMYKRFVNDHGARYVSTVLGEHW